MVNYKIMIVFLFFFFCLPAEADYLDDLGLRNNDPKLIGKIASLKKRNVEYNNMELTFEIILKNVEDAPKKIIFTYPRKIGIYVPRIILFAYSENDWLQLNNGIRMRRNSIVVPGKSQELLIFDIYISQYADKYLNSLLKIYIGGHKISPTDWGKSIEIDFWIKHKDLPKIMGQ